MVDLTSCISYNKDQPICLPNENTTWYLGTKNFVTWYIFNPIYNPYESLNLYFYYEKDYFYYQTINFTNIGTNRGFFPVFIDNQWFPMNCTEKDINWNYTLLLLGNKINPNNILNDTLSQWKPVKFNIIQNASLSCSNNNNYNISNINNEDNKTGNKLDTWKIIVIVILIIVTLIITILLFYIRKKLFRFFKKDNNLNEKIIYIENVCYQKPDEPDYHKN